MFVCKWSQTYFCDPPVDVAVDVIRCRFTLVGTSMYYCAEMNTARCEIQYAHALHMWMTTSLGSSHQVVNARVHAWVIPARLFLCRRRASSPRSFGAFGILGLCGRHVEKLYFRRSFVHWNQQFSHTTHVIFHDFGHGAIFSLRGQYIFDSSPVLCGSTPAKAIGTYIRASASRGLSCSLPSRIVETS